MEQQECWSRFDNVKTHAKLMEEINDLYALIHAKNKEIEKEKYSKNQLYNTVIVPIQDLLSIDRGNIVDDTFKPIQEKLERLQKQVEDMKDALEVKEVDKPSANIVKRFQKLKMEWKLSAQLDAVPAQLAAVKAKLHAWKKLSAQLDAIQAKLDEQRNVLCMVWRMTFIMYIAFAVYVVNIAQPYIVLVIPGQDRMRLPDAY
jgi:hypothetical protein